MKKLLYIFIGIAIALGAVMLYSFKAKENAEISYAFINGNSSNISIYYDDGQEEDAEKVLDIKLGGKRDKGQLPFENMMSKTLKYMSQKGYRVVGQSASNPGGSSSYTSHHYTLIKEN